MATAEYAVSLEELVGPQAQLAATTVDAFAHPGESTRVLLTHNGQIVPGGQFSSGENHAEYEMLRSDAWARTLAAVGRAGTAAHRVAVVINRTPCHFVFGSRPWMDEAPATFFAGLEARIPAARVDRPWCGCSMKLASALKAFWTTYPDARRNASLEFVLACRGYYDGRRTTPLAYRKQQAPTTTFDLGCLVEAGWRVRALSVGKTLSGRGQALADVLPRVEAWVAGGR
ncbi:MAG TPA: hypothetical protein VN848_01165 [Gemmatimonadales bacterium]|nr:hypothetical protein [Gemmatimonadales bacterium]